MCKNIYIYILVAPKATLLYISSCYCLCSHTLRGSTLYAVSTLRRATLPSDHIPSRPRPCGHTDCGHKHCGHPPTWPSSSPCDTPFLMGVCNGQLTPPKTIARLFEELPRTRITLSHDLMLKRFLRHF